MRWFNHRAVGTYIGQDHQLAALSLRAEPSFLQGAEAPAESDLLRVVDLLPAQDHQRMSFESVVYLREDGIGQRFAQIHAGDLDAKNRMQRSESEHGQWGGMDRVESV